MPEAARKTVDSCDGSCGFPPAPAQSGSPNVNINGNQAMRLGDPFQPHPHTRVVAAGSSTVNINGKAAARKGDPLTCGANIATGSPNVNIG